MRQAVIALSLVLALLAGCQNDDDEFNFPPGVDADGSSTPLPPPPPPPPPVVPPPVSPPAPPPPPPPGSTSIPRGAIDAGATSAPANLRNVDEVVGFLSGFSAAVATSAAGQAPQPAARSLGVEPKEAQACADGGTVDVIPSGTSSTVVFVNCVQNNSRQDGKSVTNISSFQPVVFDLEFVPDDEGENFLTENRLTGLRSISTALGRIQITIDSDPLDPGATNIRSSLNHRGNYINLERADPATATYRFTDMRFDFRLRNNVSESELMGRVGFSGLNPPCVNGEFDVVTNSPLIGDTNSAGIFNRGMLTVNFNGGAATVTYNDDGTMTIVTPGGTERVRQDRILSGC